MKVFSAILKILAAAAAIVGAVYVAATYGDKIVAWAKKLLPECPCCKCDCDGECTCEKEETAEVEAPVEEVAEPVAPVVEVPAEEVPVVEENEPVADEADFEG